MFRRKKTVAMCIHLSHPPEITARNAIPLSNSQIGITILFRLLEGFLPLRFPFSPANGQWSPSFLEVHWEFFLVVSGGSLYSGNE